MIAWTVVYNRCDLLAWQVECIRRFCPRICELAVVNNGPQFNDIDGECNRLGLRTVRCLDAQSRAVQLPGPATSNSHGIALDTIWRQEYLTARDRVLLVDFDCFPITVDADDVFGDYDICGLKRSGIGVELESLDYPSPVLTAVRHGLADVADVSWLPVDSAPNGYADPGARVGLYLREHPEATVRWLSKRPASIVDFPVLPALPADWDWSIIADKWLHFRAGSGYWGRGVEFEIQRTAALLTVLGAI